METMHFTDKNGTFFLLQPENYSYLYFPVAGENGIKSALTPNLGGDIKTNQNAFLMEPVSAENLHNNRSGRNFWCHVEGVGAWSAVGASAEEESRKFTKNQDKSELTAGLMWQALTRQSEKYQLRAQVTSFVPFGDNVELMHVELCNMAQTAQTITPIAAIPIYGRSADNIRDHRHVTSLLHRIRTTDYGVYVKPTLSFDERGHRKNELTYFVCGVSGTGEKPKDFYPVAQDYIGEGGSFTHPRKVLQNGDGVPGGQCFAGKEALGGLRFETIVLEPNASVSYTIVMGVTAQEDEIEHILSGYDSKGKVRAAFAKTRDYWQQKVNVRYDTGDVRYDNLLRWISFQPILRRIYGCSFLPHHDYGRGGRGWRDLWQDCLSLLIMDPCGVRKMILDNYGGVRIDGTNATIIGEEQGVFVADRNGIARVWMDHGVWPFMTTKLYIDQTGDTAVLKEQAPYFKDGQMQRGGGLDSAWDTSYGLRQKDENGAVYEGSILEHLLLEHLCAFYEVGAHNHIRLRGADWNDALDMAAENGESVAFTCAYAGNLLQLAQLLEQLSEQPDWQVIAVLAELEVLLADDGALYEDVGAKQELLQRYLQSCQHNISGERISVSTKELAQNLYHKAQWLAEHIRRTEWISQAQHEDEGWFNSYYDNNKARVEGYFENGVRMLLTGQVFAIMSETATKEQVEKICRSADRYLYQKEIGGYRLNTDFGELKFDLGRMFGFAYGEKENGAVFSHMTVMYANALYQRGFVKEGYKALQTLADAAMNFETSRIYPGIPEYFNGSGRGMYHYLTGAASWYMLTVVTQVFGVRGALGDMVLCPKLCAEQFDAQGNAKICFHFAQKEFEVVYKNPQKLSYGEYAVKKVFCDGQECGTVLDSSAVLDRETIVSLSDTVHTIEAELGAKQEEN